MLHNYFASPTKYFVYFKWDKVMYISKTIVIINA